VSPGDIVGTTTLGGGDTVAAKRHDHHGRAVPEGSEVPRPGDLVVGPDGTAPEVVSDEFVYETAVVAEPIVGEATDSPLADDEPEGNIPANPLWAMKARRHGQFHLFHHGDDERIREAVGQGNDTVYAIDDGRDHVMLGRRVGVSPSGCQYGLVGRVAIGDFDALCQGELDARGAFDQAGELALCGVVQVDEVLTGEIFEVAVYGGSDEVPAEYLPGGAFIEFPDDLDLEID
jgi:hypothetical protein